MRTRTCSVSVLVRVVLNRSSRSPHRHSLNRPRHPPGSDLLLLLTSLLIAIYGTPARSHCIKVSHSHSPLYCTHLRALLPSHLTFYNLFILLHIGSISLMSLCFSFAFH